eukprot:scaffold5611_cov132-Isochrysis_galbana.AAC.9
MWRGSYTASTWLPFERQTNGARRRSSRGKPTSRKKCERARADRAPLEGHGAARHLGERTGCGTVTDSDGPAGRMADSDARESLRHHCRRHGAPIHAESIAGTAERAAVGDLNCPFPRRPGQLRPHTPQRLLRE